MSTYYLWKTKVTEKRLLMIGLIAFIVIWIVSKFTFEPLYREDAYTSITAKSIEIITASWLFFDVLGDSTVVVNTNARLWISLGIILYSCATLFLFASFNMMLDNSPGLILILWPINWILSIIFTLLLARGDWCRATP